MYCYVLETAIFTNWASTNNPSAFMPCMACYSFKKQNFDKNFLIEFKSKGTNIIDINSENNLNQIFEAFAELDP